MEKLYNIYTDFDKIILINKNVKGEVRILMETDFEFDNEIEEGNLIFCYSPIYKILNNGYRHLYDITIYEDLSNIKIFYDEAGILSEFGVISELDKIYIPVYIRYNLLRIKEDIQLLINAISDFFIKNIKLNFNKENIYTMGLLYFYDSEAIDINLTIGTESERVNIKKKRLDTEYLGNYSLRVNLSGEIKDILDTFILSISKDELMDESELLKHIVVNVEERLKTVLWKDVINFSEDFNFQKSEQYD